MAFLDITIYHNHNHIGTDLYMKPMETHQYFFIDSCLPAQCKASIPYSQVLRLRRICLEEENFHKRAYNLKNQFSSGAIWSSIWIQNYKECLAWLGRLAYKWNWTSTSLHIHVYLYWFLTILFNHLFIWQFKDTCICQSFMAWNNYWGHFGFLIDCTV